MLLRVTKRFGFSVVHILGSLKLAIDYCNMQLASLGAQYYISYKVLRCLFLQTFYSLSNVSKTSVSKHDHTKVKKFECK